MEDDSLVELHGSFKMVKTKLQSYKLKEHGVKSRYYYWDTKRLIIHISKDLIKYYTIHGKQINYRHTLNSSDVKLHDTIKQPQTVALIRIRKMLGSNNIKQLNE